ncbi:unnamed protein product, partial [Larinioides sclopetarius]
VKNKGYSWDIRHRRRLGEIWFDWRLSIAHFKTQSAILKIGSSSFSISGQ